ncbi:hypothetical protein HOK021_68090 [Streptomyces hygroscopicus]|nr:hypothetical protein HOK021_68090 [Streptomyces hygroscopicus]
MFPRIISILERLLRSLLPPSGGRKAVFPATTRVTGRVPVPALRCSRATYVAVVRGEDTALIRPYLVAHERTHGLEAPA